jgi:biopolymer transport protein ExbD
MRKVQLHLPGGGRPNSDINVTPLVDVVLVLLIIFMVVTPLLEKDIEVRIPNTEEVPEEVEAPPDQIVVSLDDKGGLFINSHATTTETFVDELRPLIDAKKDDKLVFFSPDEKASYGLLVTALDGAKAAGATILGVTTDKAAPLVVMPGPVGVPAPAPPPGAVPPAPAPEAPKLAPVQHQAPPPPHKKHR